MILYIKNPKDSTAKLLELILEFSKVAEYKINTQKSVAFLHTNNELIEREIRKAITFTMLCNSHHHRSSFQNFSSLQKETDVLIFE